MNAFERALSAVAPGFAAKRARARMQLAAFNQAKAYYDGADTGRRGNSIRRSGASANSITARTLPKLRAGARDLVRNNPHARRGVEAIVSNVFGSGIIPRFKRGKETANELDELARRTLDTTEIDAAGQHDIYGLQALAGTTAVESGEALILREWVRDGLFPVRFRVLEPDFLDGSRDTIRPDGSRVIQGVEFDRRGRRTGYWLYTEHPGGRLIRAKSEFFPARDVAHVYRVERPGQVRGIPWLAPVMLRMADFDDYESAQLIRQKIAACFVAFVSDELPGDGSDATPRLDEKVEPGIIQRINAGSEVEFGNPPPVNDYKDYAKTSIRAIAAGLGISYEAISGDLEGVNFASGRMGRLEMLRNVERWRWHTFVPQACDVMTRWWLEGAELMGERTRGVTTKHTPPAREMILPEREVPARTAALRSGQMSMQQQAAERGLDLEELLDEIQEAQRMLDERQIVLDSDARKVSKAGVFQVGEFSDD